MKSKKPSSAKLPEHYSSIDYLPILNWEMIHKKNDFSYLLIKQKPISDKQKKLLSAVWIKIYDEYIEAFGFGEQFNDMMKMKIDIAKLTLKKIISKKESLENFIKVAEVKLGKMQVQVTGGSIYKAKAMVEKKLGIRIPLKDTSVREFYSYLQDIK